MQPGTRNTFNRALQAVAIGGLAVACSLASAQAPPQPASPPRMPPTANGTIVRLDGQTLTLRTPEESQRTVMLSSKLQIINQTTVPLSEVQSGKFIGVTAVEEADGKLHAREVHIFPEAMRGAGEGHYPMNGPNTTMTNGNVATMTNGSVMPSANSAAKGLVLNIAYKGGQSQIEVAPDVPVTLMSPGNETMLTPGTRVTAILQPGGDAPPAGPPTAGTIIIGGLRPAGSK